MNSGIRISNRQVIVFVAAIVLFGQVCLAKYSGGSGTSGTPYKIGTAADLLALGANTTITTQILFLRRISTLPATPLQQPSLHRYEQYRHIFRRD